MKLLNILLQENIMEGLGGPMLLIFVVLFVLLTIIILIKRYKRCPSDRILVVYGKVGGGQSAKCIHGGAAFILPVIQDFEFLDFVLLYEFSF